VRLTARRLKHILHRYHEQLGAHRAALNRLNVYPVPDGDTGTNMTLTVRAVLDEIGAAESMEEVTRGIAHGSLMGARGNSGVILSQILRGLADAFRHTEEVGAGDLVEALDLASAAAYQAVMRPVEGTILTVLRVASEAAAEAGTSVGDDLAALLARVYEQAEEALEETPNLLPVLKQAGVVDAGGAGFLLLIGAFLEEVTGTTVALPARLLVNAVTEAAGETDASSLRYEVMFFLEAPDSAIDEFRAGWADLGDSIVVVGGDGLWNCHIHTDQIGASIEAGITVGRPYQIRVTDLAEQADGFHGTLFEPLPEFLTAPIGIVPVAVGPGIENIFRSAGAQGLVRGGQTMNPSTQDLIAAVERVPAETVVVLPNNKNIVPVALQVDTATTKRVHVVPTRSVPEGLAAMMAYVPAATDVEKLVEAMASAAAGVVAGEVTRAVRDAETAWGSIKEGDWFGLVDGAVSSVSADLTEAMQGLLEHALEEHHELVTIITGDGATPTVTGDVRAWLAAHRPGVEAEVVDGGQPLYPYLVSIE
jgi:DAK2 domain fusion protein YloV